MNIEETKNRRIFGLLGLCAKAGKIVSGTDATILEMEKRKIQLVIIANDASDKTKKNMKYICEKNKVEIIEFGSIEKLSNCIGKTNKAIIGIKSKNIADGIRKSVSNENGGDLLDG